MSQPVFLMLMTAFGFGGLALLCIAVGLYATERTRGRRPRAPLYCVPPRLYIPPSPPHAAPSRFVLPHDFDPTRN